MESVPFTLSMCPELKIVSACVVGAYCPQAKDPDTGVGRMHGQWRISTSHLTTRTSLRLSISIRLDIQSMAALVKPGHLWFLWGNYDRNCLKRAKSCITIKLGISWPDPRSLKALRIIRWLNTFSRTGPVIRKNSDFPAGSPAQ